MALLGDVSIVGTGQSAPQDPSVFTEDGYPFVRAGSLERLILGESEDNLEKIVPENAKKYRLKLYPKDTVLFAKSGMSAKLGRVYRLKKPCYVVSHLATIIPSKDLDPGYLHRWFEANPPSLLINNDAYPSIKKSVISGIDIPLPELSKQKRIATIIDKADSIGRKRQECLDLTDQFLRSVFLDMFGHDNPVMSIQELLDEGYLLLHKDGNHGGNYPRKHEFGNIGIPFISAKDVSEDDGLIDYSTIAYLNESKARQLTIGWLKKGDVLLAHNATVGRVGLFNGEVSEALIGTSLTAFRPNPDKLTSQYLFCALKYSGFQNQLQKIMGQSTRNQVPITAQKELMIPVGNIEKQKEIENIYRKISDFRKYNKNAIDESKILLSSISQKAFSGIF